MSNYNFSSNITNLFALIGFGGLSRQNNRGLWAKTIQQLPFIPVYYSHASIDYRLSYQQGCGVICEDISIILVYEKRPCGVWPLSFSVKDGISCISSFGNSILPPLFIRDSPAKSRKTLVKKCQEFLEKICLLENIAQWESAESFAGAVNVGLSDWHLQAMTQGASVTLGHELFIDLSLDIATIKSYFRKSYKPLISSGLRTWKVGVLAEKNSTIWNEFRELHRQVCGRVTRSSESWDIQHLAIMEGDALLVFLRDKNDMMVGGGFFYLTRDQGLYGVGVYERLLFDKPLGHVVQFRAIEEMKKRGIRWYKIGIRAYPFDVVSSKDLSISEFKQGFASHFFPQYKLRCEIE